MSFEVVLSEAAGQQIDEQTTWYELQQFGLGQRFYKVVMEHLAVLETTPFAQLRYDKIRCVPIKGFPVMLHIGVNEVKREVHIFALIHTSRNPGSNWGKDDWIFSEPVYYYGVAAG